MDDKRFSIDPVPTQRQDGMQITIPINPGAVKTMAVIVLGEDGRVHVAGPMNEPTLMNQLLNRARLVLEKHQRARLVQPVQGLCGLSH